MTSDWVLQTQGHALGAVQAFLGRLWVQAELEAMFAPLRPSGSLEVNRTLVEDQAQLADADPFAPLMTRNVGCQVLELALDHPQRKMAALLRACEVRALQAVASRTAAPFANLLTVGVDCLCTFSPQDYERRAREVGGPDELTREALLFARQGGVAPYRYRSACQMCEQPIPQGADLVIGVLGLSAGQAVLISAHDRKTAERLRLGELTDGPAPPALVARREQMQAMLAERHERVRARKTDALADVPLTMDQLVAHLRQCAPCEECLKACPVYAGELADPSLSVRRWLESCAGCGMCEQACPRGMPLAAIIGHIHRELEDARLRRASGTPADALLYWA